LSYESCDELFFLLLFLDFNSCLKRFNQFLKVFNIKVTCVFDTAYKFCFISKCHCVLAPCSTLCI